MFPTSFLLLALSALSLSASTSALPTTTTHLHLARGWSHSLKISSTLAARAYDTGIPFTEEEVITSNCIAECVNVVALNSTCGTSYYKTDCDMCSTVGLDSFTTCASCWAQSKPVKEQAKSLGYAAAALSKIEQFCQSYTRTALPSISLSLTPSLPSSDILSSNSTSSFAVQSAGTSSIAFSSSSSSGRRCRSVGLSGRLGVAVGAIVVVAGVIGVSLV